MKGVLLHGGHGTRLRPLTHSGPKQLIPVAGKPISQYCLEDLCSAGVKDVLVILGSVWPEKVQEFYGDGSKLGMKLHYIHQGEPKGLAQAVGLAKEFIGDEKFVTYLGDNLLRGGITGHVSSFASSDSDAMVLLTKVAEPERFGVAKFDDNGKLQALMEKPKPPPSPYALVGVYFFSPTVFEAIHKLKPSWRGELEITDAIQYLLTAGRKVTHSFVQGWWKDTGTPEDILDANRLILDEKMPSSDIRGDVGEGSMIQGRVRIEEGAVIMKECTIRGPAHIGRDSTIGPGTYIGPYTSIGNSCRLISCEIENSVVMDGCRIEARQRITDSLIGPQSEILGHNGALPKGYRFVLGEGSKLQL